MVSKWFWLSICSNQKFLFKYIYLSLKKWINLKKHLVNNSASGKYQDMVKIGIFFSRMTHAGKNTAKSKWV